MVTFQLQCINYLLANGWQQDVDGWDWYLPCRSGQPQFAADSLCAALSYQFFLEEAEYNPEPED